MSMKYAFTGILILILIAAAVFVLLPSNNNYNTSPGVCAGNSAYINSNPQVIINYTNSGIIYLNSSVLIANGEDVCLANRSGLVSYYIQLTNTANSTHNLTSFHITPSSFNVSGLYVKNSTDRLYNGNNTNWTILENYVFNTTTVAWQPLNYDAQNLSIKPPFKMKANSTAYLEVNISIPDQEFNGNLTFFISTN